MIIIQNQVGEYFVFAHYPQNDTEEKELRTLVREVAYINRDRIQGCGLWILKEMELDGRSIIVTSVNQKVELDESNLVQFRTAVIEKLKGEHHDE